MSDQWVRLLRQEEQIRKDQEIREQVFGHYGRVCACCGATKGLTIDHVNGDGKAHREELTCGFYTWLVREGFPPGFQVLCIPCNSSKGTGLACKMHDEIRNLKRLWLVLPREQRIAFLAWAPELDPELSGVPSVNEERFQLRGRQGAAIRWGRETEARELTRRLDGERVLNVLRDYRRQYGLSGYDESDRLDLDQLEPAGKKDRRWSFPVFRSRKNQSLCEPARPAPLLPEPAQSEPEPAVAESGPEYTEFLEIVDQIEDLGAPPHPARRVMWVLLHRAGSQGIRVGDLRKAIANQPGNYLIHRNTLHNWLRQEEKRGWVRREGRASGDPYARWFWVKPPDDETELDEAPA